MLRRIILQSGGIAARSLAAGKQKHAYGTILVGILFNLRCSAQVAAKEELCADLEAEVLAVGAVAAKAQERVRVLEPEVSALAAQAEQAGLELAEAAKV